MLEEDLQPLPLCSLTKIVGVLGLERTLKCSFYISSAPSGPPQNFTTSIGSRYLTLSWSPPLPSQQNGVIINYVLNCSSGGSIINSTRTSSTSLTITGLEPFTNYTCSVSASTIEGNGPTTVRSVVTKPGNNNQTVYYYKVIVIIFIRLLTITAIRLVLFLIVSVIFLLSHAVSAKLLDNKGFSVSRDVGESVTFSCIADGIPRPRITWRRNNQLLDSKRRERYQVVTTSSEGFRSAEQPGVQQLKSVLTITDLKEQDQGAYSCLAQSADTIPAVLLAPYELSVVKRESLRTSLSHQ